MTVSIHRFHLFAKLVGGLLALMGASLLGVFAMGLVTGENPLAGELQLDAAGMVILATVGAFQLPLGLSLLGRDSRTSFRLRVAAAALGGMALLRLAAFVDPTMRAALGTTPLIEALLFGGIAAAALVLRPEGEAPIEIMREFDLPVPATAAWALIADRFGDVADFASGVRTSHLDGDLGVGAVRVCESEPFGPFESARLTEELVEFEPACMRYAYEAGGDLPSFIPASRNRWSVVPTGADRCRVRSHASVDLAAWAVPFAPLLAWTIGGAVDRFGHDLRAHFATHPAG